MSRDSLLVEDRLPASILTLNRPDQLNALSTELMSALLAELPRQAARPEVRAIVLRGAGRAFSPGHDLREMLGKDVAQQREIFDLCTLLMTTVQEVSVPVIAQVQGIATAAGCQLVASCDLAIASCDARFATSGIRYGLFCFTPGVAVSRSIARKHALEMLMTGRFIDAATAERWGLVNRVVKPEQLEQAVMDLVHELSLLSRTVLSAGKRGFYRQVDLPQPAAYALMGEAIADNAASAFGQEGICAFVEKRRPVFSG